MSSRPPPPDVCGNCGAAIPRGARACPECGADERTNWGEGSVYDGLDLPGGEEVGEPPTFGRPPGWRHPLQWYWLAAAGLVVVVLVLTALGLW